MSTGRIAQSDAVQALFEQAKAVRERAHAPYSGYRVGVALRDNQGNTWTGCNVENASYPEGSCAETAAIAAMVAGGGNRLRELVVAGGQNGIEACTPCGGCRQRISEFADAGTRVWLVDDGGALREYTVPELLPHGFRLEGRD